LVMIRIVVRFARGRTKDWHTPRFADFVSRRLKSLRR
jgi:hypothetical protein